MNNLIEIQNQIAALQKQEQEIKSAQFTQIVLEIKEKMAAYGITPADLEDNRSRAYKTASVKSLNPAPAKYRGPNGETWSGRGLTPRWLTALVVAGAAKEDFAINA